ncbi:hypothetical protein HNY73_020947 [Argiope bruennichi]|uniref:Uncharacterized protein n=1 Tax=Argiope bruennichi TaxID=94029 RepID=A0A8T0E8L5_ARGBR|nr:hypothetical protein HNY73_020947 [Argiope bruennichi]
MQLSFSPHTAKTSFETKASTAAEDDDDSRRNHGCRSNRYLPNLSTLVSSRSTIAFPICLGKKRVFILTSQSERKRTDRSTFDLLPGSRICGYSYMTIPRKVTIPGKRN